MLKKERILKVEKETERIEISRTGRQDSLLEESYLKKRLKKIVRTNNLRLDLTSTVKS